MINLSKMPEDKKISKPVFSEVVKPDKEITAIEKISDQPVDVLQSATHYNYKTNVARPTLSEFLEQFGDYRDRLAMKKISGKKLTDNEIHILNFLNKKIQEQMDIDARNHLSESKKENAETKDFLRMINNG